MSAQDDVAASKYLSWMLRHEPHAVGLTLTAEGWVSIDELIAAAAADGRTFTRARVRELVSTNEKRRFALSHNGLMIRAVQGHSVPVQLDYPPAPPPEVLFHGTVAAARSKVRTQGLRRGQRHHVHLSPDPETATSVGARRGAPVLLTIHAKRMAEAGFVFYQAPNGVWLVEHVPPAYIRFDDTSS
ncbi:MAG: RNA 2'-phosphotransferase [Nannocystales bacterium]